MCTEMILFTTKRIKGVPQFDLKEIGETDQTGTAIRFKADGEILQRQLCIIMKHYNNVYANLLS